MGRDDKIEGAARYRKKVRWRPYTEEKRKRRSR